MIMVIIVIIIVRIMILMMIIMIRIIVVIMMVIVMIMIIVKRNSDNVISSGLLCGKQLPVAVINTVTVATKEFFFPRLRFWLEMVAASQGVL